MSNKPVMPEGVTLIRHTDTSSRRRIIREVVNIWYEADPKTARSMANFIDQITKVDVRKDGRWKEGNGYVKVRLPADLWHSLRVVFSAHLPDEQPFGQDEEDIRILAQEFPKLVPTKHRL